MGKRNIVICSDGTGNTFDNSISNVTQLIKLLNLESPEKQIVIYDQGIGTNAERVEAVDRFKESIPNKDTLICLNGPDTGWLAKILGLAFGYGFEANLKQMYQKLSELYEGPGDNIYLFGFSRGAFTVRALAGLIYRCGLPRKSVNFDVCFDEAYRIYAPIQKDSDKANKFRRDYDMQDCKIHFLGIWDTVKSYGGVKPILLPHLRHNPIVETVRHALALDEKRSWFNVTTWGQLDSDRRKNSAKDRLDETLTETEKQNLAEQSIEEVWFRGCHSDIGGGDEEAVTATVALRWIVGEAYAEGIQLNNDGKSMLTIKDPIYPVEIHESLSLIWKLAVYIQFYEIDNSGKYPILKCRSEKNGQRDPDAFTRDGKILLHTSVGNLHSICVPVEHRATKQPYICPLKTLI